MAFDPAQRTVVIRDPALRQFDGGFTAIPNRILESQDLSLGARMTYAMLLKYAWQKDFCWPAQERIAIDLGVSDRSVRTFLGELRDRHLVTWKQQGLNRPNVYYLLKLPDVPTSQPDHAGAENFSGPDRQSTSGQDRQSTSDKEYTKKNTQYVNVNALPTPLEDGKEEALLFEMLGVLGDRHSTGLYRRIAQRAPEDLIYETLAETKYQANMGRVQKTRGAVFTDLIKRRAKELGIDLGLRD